MGEDLIFCHFNNHLSDDFVLGVRYCSLNRTPLASTLRQ